MEAKSDNTRMMNYSTYVSLSRFQRQASIREIIERHRFSEGIIRCLLEYSPATGVDSGADGS